MPDEITPSTDADKIVALEKQVSDMTAALGEARRALAVASAQCQAIANQRNAFANEAAAFAAQLSVSSR